MSIKIGDKVKIKELKKIGIVLELNSNGVPTKVVIDDEIIDIINLTIVLLGFFKRIWIEIKKAFQ